MSSSRLLLVPAVILTIVSWLSSCGTTGATDPEHPTASASQPATGVEMAPGETADSPGATKPPTADVTGEVIMTWSFGSLDSILNQGVAYIQPHLPGPFRAILAPDALKRQLFKVLGLPQLEQVFDGGKPVALAMADPETYRGKLRPLMLALPVTDPDRTADLLGQAAERHERTAWGDHLYTTPRETVRVRFIEGYALVAADEKLINGAADVLLPLVRGAKGAVGHLHVRLDSIYSRHGRQIERAIGKLQRKMKRRVKRGRVGEAGVMQLVGRWMGYLKSTRDLKLSVELKPALVRMSGSVAAKGPGNFATYLKQLSPGPAWGAKFIPADSGLIYLRRQGPQLTTQHLDESLAMIKGPLKGLVPEATLQKLRDLVVETYKHFPGEGAAGIWVNADGGFGAGGAARVTDAPKARATWLKAIKLMAKEVNRVATKLPPEIKNQLNGASLKLRVRPGGLRVAGARGDLVELSIVWPRPKNREARKEIAKIKKRVTKVLGRRLTLAVAFVNDTVLLTLGKDHRRRIAKMVAIAKGGPGTGVEKKVQSYAAGKRIVDLVHVPVAVLAEQVMRLVDQLTTVPARVKQAFHNILPGPGKSVPATAVLHVEGQRLLLEADISPEVVGMIAKAGIAAFSRFRSGAPPPIAPPP